jgi:type IX secretion system PorP/SprF family membrane protein
MKRLIAILMLLIPGYLYGQQFPYMDDYSVNPFNFSPAYAGIVNRRTLFMDYRSDWSGIEGGPKTYQLSYSDKFRNRVGLGMRFIYDKADIFKQTLLLGTYSYQVKIGDGHTLNFSLSAGLYRNTIDLSKYYNDPGYVEDLALIYGQQTSMLKFATDIGALYRFRDAEAGILFSNIMFGTVKYHNSEMTYKPFSNYMFHAAYNFSLADKWTIKPLAVYRGGQYIPMQIEISQTTTYNKRLWLTTLYRTTGIIGLGIGGEIVEGVYLNYSYDLNNNMTAGVSLGTYGSQQMTLGIRLFKVTDDKHAHRH